MSNGTNGNGSWTWPKVVYEAGKTFGVPTVLVLFLCWWLVFQVTPPVLDAVKQFVASTVGQQKALVGQQKALVETQESIADTLAEISAAAQEIVTVERESQEFMEIVRQEHTEHQRKLAEIKEAVSK